MAQFVLDVNLQIQKVLGLEEVKAQLSSVAGTQQIGISTVGAKESTAALGATQVAAAGAAQAINSVAAAEDKVVGAVADSNKFVKEGAGLFDNYASRVGLAGARYSAFVVATAVPFAGLAVIGAATRSIIELDNAVVKLSQILRQPKDDINALREEIIKLSVDTGTSIKQISDAALILAQAGFLKGPQDFAKFLEPLSKIPLLPTFKDIEQATEGVIAALGQFAKAGLEPIDVLDKITRVSDKYAVESNDLIEVLKRTGGTFSALGGSIDELFAIFTTLRSTTRENAESLSTALKTITTRLARPATLTFLESIGISVKDQKGELLGLIDIFKNVSDVFEKSGKEQQAAIAEQLGGIRNIGRIFAGLTGDATKLTDQILAVSQASSGAVSQSAAKALEKISTQIDILVARFNQLAQSLAEPVFAPFIHGALTLGNALVTVLDTVKPVIPLFVELIGLAAGLKIFNFATSSILGLSKALSEINLGGLEGLGGLSFGAKSVAGPGQAVIPVGGVGARQVRGVGAVASNLAGSQIGQLGALLGLNLIAGKLADSFAKTDDSVAKLGLEAVGTATTLLGLASIISGQSLIGLFKNLGLLGGTLLGVGAIGAGIVTAVAGQNAIDIDELIQKASKKVNGLDVQINPGSQIDLQNAISHLTTPIIDIFSSITSEFDPATFAGIGNEFAERLKAIFSGDISKGLGLDLSESIKGNIEITNADQKKIIDTIIGQNPKLLSDIVKESFVEFGPNFQEGLQKNLEEMLEPFKDIIDVKDFATKLRTAFIAKLGGISALPDIKLNAEREAANRLLVESTRRISDDLRKIIIPQTLGGELLRLTEVVQKTVSSIDSSISSFDVISATIGKIETPQLPTTVSDIAIRKSIQSGGLNLGAGFNELDQATQEIVQIQEAITNFIKSFELSLGDISKSFRSGISAEQIVDNFVDAFLEDAKNLSPDVQESIKNSSGQIARAIDEAFASSKFGLDPDKIKDILKTAFGNLADVSDAAVQNVKTLLESQLRLANTQNKVRDLQSQIISSESTRLPTILQALSESLQVLGFSAIDIVPEFQNAQDGFNFLGTAVGASTELLDLLGPALEKRNNLEKQVDEAIRNNASNTGDLIKQYNEASTTVRDLKEATVDLGKAADIASSAISSDSQDLDAIQIKQAKEQIDFIKEIGGLASKLTELDAATKASNIFADAQSRFSISVDKFGEEIKTFGINQVNVPVPTTGTPGTSFGGATPIGPTQVATQNGQIVPLETNIQQLPAINAELQKIFDEQLNNQRSFLEKLIGEQFRLPGTPPSSPDINQAIKDTLNQIAQNNLANPNIETNPLAPFGSNVEDIKKALNLKIDDDTKSKLILRLSPEAEKLLQPFGQGATGILPSNIPASQESNNVSDLFGSVITNLQSFIETLKPIPGNGSIIAQTQQETPITDFVKTISDKIGELVAVVQSQTDVQQQVVEAQKPQEINTEAIDSAKEATNKNSEALASANEGISTLTGQLSKTEEALAKGVDLTLETVQNVNVNVTGVSDEIGGISTRLEVVARDIAKNIILNVLDNLERSATDTNTALAFNNAKSALG